MPVESSPNPPGPRDIWKSLKRSPRLHISGSKKGRPARRTNEQFRAGLFGTSLRLLVWAVAVSRFVLGIVFDKLLRRDGVERRAKRLRRVLESSGTTLVKLGQQASLRVDLLPYEFIVELEQMLDNVPGYIPQRQLEHLVRQATGPLEEVFSAFDPAPVACGSIACVYKATLKNGKEVVVKVRRPKIGRRLKCDLRALSWLLWIGELFLLPRGFTKNLITELDSMLMEELDFRREARYSEIFHRDVRSAGYRWVRTPKAYVRLSNHEVLVSELVSGIWLTDMLQAVETKDEKALALLEALRIDPKKVARRLLCVSRYGAMEGLVFHADLHPANVLVRPKSRLTLIDFGSCGTQTERERHSWRQFLFAQAKGDVSGMAEATLRLFGSIPPVDVAELQRKIEAVFWQDLCAHRSKKAEWWERTSVGPWIGVLSLAREYAIPIAINTVRLIRISLVVDTLATRLHHKLDHYDEYWRFERDAGGRARDRLKQRLNHLRSDGAYVRYEELFDLVFSTFFRAQDALDQVRVSARLEGVLAYGVGSVLRAASWIILATIASGFYELISTLNGNTGVMSRDFVVRELATRELWFNAVTEPVYVAYVLAIAVVHIRDVLARLDAKQPTE